MLVQVVGRTTLGPSLFCCSDPKTLPPFSQAKLPKQLPGSAKIKKAPPLAPHHHLTANCHVSIATSVTRSSGSRHLARHQGPIQCATSTSYTSTESPGIENGEESRKPTSRDVRKRTRRETLAEGESAIETPNDGGVTRSKMKERGDPREKPRRDQPASGSRARQVSRYDSPRRNFLSDYNGSLLAALAGATWEQRIVGGAEMVGRTVSETIRKGGVVLLEGPPLGFPPGPGGDMALAMAGDPLKCIEQLKSDFGGAVGMTMAGERVVLVSDPALAREVLVAQSDVFIKAGTAFFPGSSLAGNGLLVSDGDTWQRQRRLSNPAFRKSAVNSYAEAMVDVTRVLLEEKWGRGGTVRDVYEDFNDLTMRVVATSLFGGGFVGEASDASEVGPAITTAFRHFNVRATSMFIVPEWFPTPDNIQYNAAVSKLDRIVYRLIAQRRAELSRVALPAGTSPRRDLLTKLLEATDEDGSRMDDTSLRDELMTLLVAGQETSAILLSWISVLLCQHPQTQERLAQEVRQALGSRSPTYADMRKLPYLEAVIYETMRLLPPAYLVGRCASQTTTLGGRWDIPLGTTILVSPYLLHRDPSHWPRAGEFDPDRWMPGGDATALADNDSYWPFGGGPRTCIGMGFAMMEVSLVVASILQRYKLSLPTATAVPTPRAMITLRPAGRVDIKLTSRS